jgi:hypothetical protein
MPRGAAPEWRKRKDPVTDDWILASVERAGGLGKHHPATGHYADLVITGLASKEEADEYKRSLFRCAHYLNRTGRAPVSMSSDRPVRAADGTYSLRFRAVDKTLARAHVLARYGTDRSKWPYDPRRRGNGS